MLRKCATLVLTMAFIIGGCSRVSIVPGAEKPKSDESPPQWSYEGATGPSSWADNYPECAGAAQSPIDISVTGHADLPELEFEYMTMDGTIVDTGHALQVNAEGGAFTVGDTTFTLRQIHFHVPSEHTLEGRRFDAVMHLVHAGEDGRLAVVAVMYELGEENDFVGDVLEAAAATGDVPTEVELEDAAPENTEYYTYQGSLTTPPCTEGVRWFVLRNPESLSEEQLAELAGYYRDNVRPIQPANERTILHSAG